MKKYERINDLFPYAQFATQEGSVLTEELASYLAAQGLVSYDATGRAGNCFVETLPDAPDLAVAIYSIGGAPPSQRNAIAFPAVRLLVRGTRDPRSAQALAQTLLAALHGLRDVELTAGGTHLYQCVTQQSAPAHQEMDAAHRHRYAVEFILHTTWP